MKSYRQSLLNIPSNHDIINFISLLYLTTRSLKEKLEAPIMCIPLI